MLSNWLVTEQDKLYLITALEILEQKPVLSEQAERFVAEISKSKDDEDLLWFRGRYCTADVRNANGDGFKLDDIKCMYTYAVFKPVNWLHDESQKIGFIVDSILKSEANENFVDTVGIVWAATPHDRLYADNVIVSFKDGMLGLSMETMGERVECSVCGTVFPIQSGDLDDPYKHYCVHLKQRKVNSDVTRWILNPKFSGVGMLPAKTRHRPADQKAWVREIASLGKDNDENRKEEELNMGDESKYTKSVVDDLVQGAKDAVHKEYEPLKSELEAIKTETKEAKDENGKLQAEIQDLKEQVSIKDGEISAMKDTSEALETEKTELEKKVEAFDEEKKTAEQKKFDDRVAELKKDGIELPEDVAEKLRADILNDDGYKRVKSLFASKESKNKPKGIDIESDSDGATKTDAEVLREAFHKKSEEDK